jgi:hypothetical protein
MWYVETVFLYDCFINIKVLKFIPNELNVSTTITKWIGSSTKMID